MSTTTVNWEPRDQEFTDTPGPLLKDAPSMVKITYPANYSRIVACSQCLDWSGYVDIIEGTVVIAEWHRIDCEILPYLREGACHGDLLPGTYCANCGTYNPNET